MTGLLDEHSVLHYLPERGLPAAGAAEALSGGVSNVVLGVGELVVKQSLPRLRVADDWPAPVDRVLTEADALELAARLTPGRVPAVHHRDPDLHTIVVQRAPAGWQDWKSQLLAGTIDPAVARTLGEVLARWHTGARGTALPGRLHATEPFAQLRVDPYHRTVAGRAPELAGPVLAVVERMLATRVCLVHGDFSPKNVLVGPGGSGLPGAPAPPTWVIDFEVAHCGDPAFDVAFLLSHLMLKSLHRPELAGGYDRAAGWFAAAYEAGAPGPVDWPYVLAHLGCLLLARVRGKSPAEYLTLAQQHHAWRLGAAVLTTGVPDLPQLATLRAATA